MRRGHVNRGSTFPVRAGIAVAGAFLWMWAFGLPFLGIGIGDGTAQIRKALQHDAAAEHIEVAMHKRLERLSKHRRVVVGKQLKPPAGSEMPSAGAGPGSLESFRGRRSSVDPTSRAAFSQPSVSPSGEEGLENRLTPSVLSLSAMSARSPSLLSSSSLHSRGGMEVMSVGERERERTAGERILQGVPASTEARSVEEGEEAAGDEVGVSGRTEEVEEPREQPDARTDSLPKENGEDARETGAVSEEQSESQPTRAAEEGNVNRKEDEEDVPDGGKVIRKGDDIGSGAAGEEDADDAEESAVEKGLEKGESERESRKKSDGEGVADGAGKSEDSEELDRPTSVTANGEEETREGRDATEEIDGKGDGGSEDEGEEMDGGRGAPKTAKRRESVQLSLERPSVGLMTAKRSSAVGDEDAGVEVGDEESTEGGGNIEGNPKEGTEQDQEEGSEEGKASDETSKRVSRKSVDVESEQVDGNSASSAMGEMGKGLSTGNDEGETEKDAADEGTKTVEAYEVADLATLEASKMESKRYPFKAAAVWEREQQNYHNHQATTSFPTTRTLPYFPLGKTQTPSPSSSRRQRQHPTLPTVMMVTARQTAPCSNPGGDFISYRVLKNKVDYARIHGMELFPLDVGVDPQLDSWWQKVAVMPLLMSTHPHIEWFFWVDSDAVITDVDFELPWSRYRSHNLVIYGWGKDVYKSRNWNGVNGGVWLIRNCNDSLTLLEEWAAFGVKGRNRVAWGDQFSAELQSRPAHFPADDQSALVWMMSHDSRHWQSQIFIENSFELHGDWLKIVDNYESMWASRDAAAAGKGGKTGSPRFPFTTHFVGCKPCSGEPSHDAEKCRVGIDRALNFADNQVLLPLGFVHKSLSLASVVPLDASDAADGAAATVAGMGSGEAGRKEASVNDGEGGDGEDRVAVRGARGSEGTGGLDGAALKKGVLHKRAEENGSGQEGKGQELEDGESLPAHEGSSEVVVEEREEGLFKRSKRPVSGGRDEEDEDGEHVPGGTRAILKEDKPARIMPQEQSEEERSVSERSSGQSGHRTRKQVHEKHKVEGEEHDPQGAGKEGSHDPTLASDDEPSENIQGPERGGRNEETESEEDTEGEGRKVRGQGVARSHGTEEGEGQEGGESSEVSARDGQAIAARRSQEGEGEGSEEQSDGEISGDGAASREAKEPIQVDDYEAEAKGVSVRELKKQDTGLTEGEVEESEEDVGSRREGAKQAVLAHLRTSKGKAETHVETETDVEAERRSEDEEDRGRSGDGEGQDASEKGEEEGSGEGGEEGSEEGEGEGARLEKSVREGSARPTGVVKSRQGGVLDASPGHWTTKRSRLVDDRDDEDAVQSKHSDNEDENEEGELQRPRLSTAGQRTGHTGRRRGTA